MAEDHASARVRNITRHDCKQDIAYLVLLRRFFGSVVRYQLPFFEELRHFILLWLLPFGDVLEVDIKKLINFLLIFAVLAAENDRSAHLVQTQVHFYCFRTFHDSTSDLLALDCLHE